MNSDQIRTMFLDFFREKGHTVIPSSSLVPRDDPTLLLTNAGMVQIKPYFLGQATPPSPRLASSQKCFRTTDIDEVGDPSHLTFFEMLGNFSVGDYFKKEAIAWAWEFLLERLKLDPARLWVTVYLDDDEAHDYWAATGVPGKRILRFGEEHNFWGPAGSSGPCGPDSEVFYDMGEEYGCGKPDCKPNCDCPRFYEIWNLVFTQYDQAENGTRTPLPKPNIDTGSGLERLTIAVNDKPSIYDTDIFRELLERVGELSGRKYGSNADDDMSIRVVAEHSRAITFLIADGVLPANDGPGYVLRRLLRRATMYGMRLGLDEPFLAELAEISITKMSHQYPELKQRRNFITKSVTGEEKRFSETLKTGLQVLEDFLSGADKGILEGAAAFKLYDTYGFPIEMTTEIAAERGIKVDMKGFEREMDKQRERARASHKFDNAAGEESVKLDVGGTEFVGYACLEKEAAVLSLLADGKIVDTIEAGQEAGIVLDASPFYAEKGGQVGDTGVITGPGGRFEVTDTASAAGDVIIHRGRVTEGIIKTGEKVTATVADDRRRDIARNHTATHLLQAALKDVLGDHIQQRGSMVAPDYLRFDFSHLAAMTPEEIKAVQRAVNREIRENHPVSGEEKDYKQAVAAGATALFDEKYGDVVRVMSIGEPSVSTELCGGTHVNATGEIGSFVITSESSIGAGLRRIEAVTGRKAEEYVETRLAALGEIAGVLQTDAGDALNRVNALRAEAAALGKQMAKLESGKARDEAGTLLEKAVTVNSVKVLAAEMKNASQDTLRETADYLRDKLGSGVIVLGAVVSGRPMFVAAVTDDLAAKGLHAGNIIREVSKVTGGGGGGKPGFAQAGGKDAGKIGEALKLVRDLVERGN